MPDEPITPALLAAMDQVDATIAELNLLARKVGQSDIVVRGPNGGWKLAPGVDPALLIQLTLEHGDGQ